MIEGLGQDLWEHAYSVIIGCRAVVAFTHLCWAVGLENDGRTAHNPNGVGGVKLLLPVVTLTHSSIFGTLCGFFTAAARSLHPAGTGRDGCAAHTDIPAFSQLYSWCSVGFQTRRQAIPHNPHPGNARHTCFDCGYGE